MTTQFKNPEFAAIFRTKLESKLLSVKACCSCNGSHCILDFLSDLLQDTEDSYRLMKNADIQTFVDDLEFAYFGLCVNFDFNSDYSKILFELWPEYSGNEDYPVKHSEISCPILAYTDTKNAYDGEYGAARIRLFEFMKENTEDFIAVVKILINELEDKA